MIVITLLLGLFCKQPSLSQLYKSEAPHELPCGLEGQLGMPDEEGFRDIVQNGDAAEHEQLWGLLRTRKAVRVSVKKFPRQTCRDLTEAAWAFRRDAAIRAAEIYGAEERPSFSRQLQGLQ